MKTAMSWLTMESMKAAASRGQIVTVIDKEMNMNNEQKMSYQPVVGDKCKFLMLTRDCSVVAEEGDTGYVLATDGREFFIRLDKNERNIHMAISVDSRIPHDLTRIEWTERVPTPCKNNVDIDAVIRTRQLEEIPSCADVEIKALTLHEMCREIRMYRLAEVQKEKEDKENAIEDSYNRNRDLH